MKWDALEKLIGLMNEHELEEIEFEDEEFRIRLKKPGAASITVAQPMAVAAPASAAAPAGESAKTKVRGRSINSPFVGTFYRAPSPDTPNFVEIGQTVRRGQTLCIIEAMKLMNEIEAEFDGTVRDAMVPNGQPIEFGQELFIIEPL